MARLKKGEKKKTQMTIRIDPDVAERLKSIDKYSVKVGDFIDAGIDEYEKWLKEKNSNKDNKDIEMNHNNSKISGISKSIYNFYDDDNTRNEHIKRLREQKIKYEKGRFYKFHPEISLKEKEDNDYLLNMLENWDKTKKVFLNAFDNYDEK